MSHTADTLKDLVPILSVEELSVGYTLGRPAMNGDRNRLFVGMDANFYPVLTDMSFIVKFQPYSSTIVGPNGTGKTTLFRALAGVVPYRGTVRWCGVALNGLNTYKRCELGITFVPNHGGIFPNLTIDEHFQLSGGRLNSRSAIEELMERVRNEHPGLESKISFLKLKTKAGNLSGGEQKLLSLLKLLFRKWSLVLLDEPTAGLSPELLEVYRVILSMLVPACVLSAEQYSRAGLARSFGSKLYELRDGSFIVSEV